MSNDHEIVRVKVSICDFNFVLLPINTVSQISSICSVGTVTQRWYTFTRAYDVRAEHFTWCNGYQARVSEFY